MKKVAVITLIAFGIRLLNIDWLCTVTNILLLGMLFFTDWLGDLNILAQVERKVDIIYYLLVLGLYGIEYPIVLTDVIIEELVFRIFLVDDLEFITHNKTSRIALASIIFAAVHLFSYGPDVVAPSLLFALCAGVLIHGHGGLVFCIMMHLLYNISPTLQPFILIITVFAIGAVYDIKEKDIIS